MFLRELSGKKGSFQELCFGWLKINNKKIVYITQKKKKNMQLANITA